MKEGKRTSYEIKAWLMRQLWFKKYVLYLMKEHPDKKEQDSFLNGEEGEHTIAGAFFWGGTKEGLTYWGKKEHKFLRWYYRRGIEIFRCKWFIIEI